VLLTRQIRSQRWNLLSELLTVIDVAALVGELRFYFSAELQEWTFQRK
jgi:hypothetical protein